MKKFVSILGALTVGAMIFMTSCSKDDTTAPTITLKGDATIDVVLNATYVDPGYTANDDKDDDVTSKVAIDYGTFNKDITGTYTLTYSVTDAAGNKGTATRTVNVKNSASNLDGTYNISDMVVGASNAVNYTDVVSSDKYINNKISFAKFADIPNAIVYANVNGNTLSIPSQIVNCGPNKDESVTFSANGSIGTGTLTITYHFVYAGDTFDGVASYTK